MASFRKPGKMEKVIDEGYRERKDLWEPLIQGPANAHIHEDLQLTLQLQRSLLRFPPRMPSSTLTSFLLFIPSTSHFPCHFLSHSLFPSQSILRSSDESAAMFIHLLFFFRLLCPVFSHSQCQFIRVSPRLDLDCSQCKTPR